MTTQPDFASIATKNAEFIDTALDAAILPYWPVWAAAQFASTDECKQILQFVHVWRDKDVFQIESTDGHRAFRFRFPAWNNDSTPTLWRVPDSGVFLPAKPLRKAVPKAKLLTVSTDLRSTFHGGPKGCLDELSSVNCAGHYAVRTAKDWKTAGTYPNINQLWPEDYSNNPAAPFAFSSTYLKQFCTVAEKLSHNGVLKVRSNSAKTPFVMSSSYIKSIGEHFAYPELEFLLMPVQIID